MRWLGHVAHMEGRELHAEFWWGNLKEHDNLDLQEIGWEDVDSDGLL